MGFKSKSLVVGGWVSALYTWVSWLYTDYPLVVLVFCTLVLVIEPPKVRYSPIKLTNNIYISAMVCKHR